MKQKKNNNVLIGSIDRPRVVFCRSNRFIRVQAIDDKNGNTLVYYSTEKEKSANKESKHFSYKNKESILKIANKFAEELKNKGYNKIIFDRNDNKYHGNVKLFCDTIRKEGINF